MSRNETPTSSTGLAAVLAAAALFGLAFNNVSKGQGADVDNKASLADSSAPQDSSGAVRQAGMGLQSPF